jgi:hypothetical protein
MRAHGRTKVIKDLGSGRGHSGTPATMTGGCVVEVLVALPCSGYIADVFEVRLLGQRGRSDDDGTESDALLPCAPNNIHGRQGHSSESNGEDPASLNSRVFVAPNRYSIVAVRTCTLLHAQS